jgi:hypothetical protein
MKRVSKKQQLVDHMIAAGNPGFRYTDVIKTVLTLKFGTDFKYDHKFHRGYYSCSISGINNYFMNGAGKCGLVKRDGLYYARYFEKSERMYRAKKTMQRKIDYATQYISRYYPLTREEVYAKQFNKITKNFLRSLKMIEKESAS